MSRPIRSSLLLITLTLAVSFAPPLRAQARDDGMVVKTYPLKSMSAADAAKLVAPYVQSARGGVFDVGTTRAITVRETPGVLKTVDSLLAVYDRAAVVVRLTFQLIATTDDETRDSAIAPVETALRGIFKFKGYRLLAQSTSMVREMGDFRSTVAGDDRRYSLVGTLSRVSLGPEGFVRLDVSLSDVTSNGTDVAQAQARAMMGLGRILSTDLTAPLGQTIVLGSGAPEDGKRVLILVVRADVQPATPR